MSTALELLSARKQQLEGDLDKLEKTVRTVTFSETTKTKTRLESNTDVSFSTCHRYNLLSFTAYRCVCSTLVWLQIYNLETEYLAAEYSQCGTVLKVLNLAPAIPFIWWCWEVGIRQMSIDQCPV